MQSQISCFRDKATSGVAETREKTPQNLGGNHAVRSSKTKKNAKKMSGS
jgi:hypothetical protein